MDRTEAGKKRICTGISGSDTGLGFVLFSACGAG
jgi:hypothetical protein